jgi:hypothetical protein
LKSLAETGLLRYLFGKAKLKVNSKKIKAGPELLISLSTADCQLPAATACIAPKTKIPGSSGKMTSNYKPAFAGRQATNFSQKLPFFHPPPSRHND